MKNKSNTIKINKIFMLCIAFLFALIIFKLTYTAVTHKSGSTNLKDFANNRDTVKTTLYATRGSILDVTGEVLAQNVNSYTVIAYLSSSRTSDIKNPKHVVDKDTTAEKLSSIINMSKEDILKLLNRKIKQCSETDINDCTYVTPYQVELGPGGRGITELTKETIEALELPGIGFIQSQKRSYQNGNFASYIIGYARKNDTGEITGEMGIEGYYNETLKGKDGYVEYQKDAYGYQIPNTPENRKEAETGSNIYLTIDNTIQLKLESVIKELRDNSEMSWVTFTIADAKTGAILGSASSPSFNPNTLNIESYVLPLSQYTYEPGSTMKIFSFMAAMENGLYNGEDTYKSGTIKVQDATIKDFNGTGWGVITYDEGFAYSSNVAATNLANKMGRDKLKSYYELLGFGKQTGIELYNEAKGVINFNYEVEVATAAFGQGISVTHIQMLQALTAIANDGIMLKPYLVDKIVNPNTKEVTYQHKVTEIAQVASKETATKMKDLMRSAVTKGYTDAKYFNANNVEVIGKSGTAQIASSSGGYLTGKYDYIRSFAGLFPYDDPKYIVYVTTKQFVGSFKKLGDLVSGAIEDIASYKNITTKETTEEKNNITLNSYLSKNVEETKLKLEGLGLKVEIIGDGNTIIDQYPTNKTVVPIGSKILLKTNGTNYLFPNVINWSYAEMNNYCSFIGLKCSYTGYGYVTETSALKEQKINIGDSVTIKLSNLYGEYLEKKKTDPEKITN